ncbi:MAG: type II secretion system protein [Methylophaga sp.]|jgi:general secretion pathway protein G|nr:type II secretion system protein [Methylophaga sp.]
MSGRQSAFTFVELMVVLAIIAVLLTIALPRYFSGLERAQEAVLKEDLFVMREAIDDYYLDKGQYPSSLDRLVQDRYLREIPVDPVTDSRETWIVLGLPLNPSVVYDVRSGARGEASDGTLYYEW